MNTNKLLEKIEASGISRDKIAKEIGLSRQGLHNKVMGKNEFKVSEINKLANLLNLSNEERAFIFFADCVDK